ncbi:MAG TPA: hypothetical protein VF059_01710 [Casimicrobiaceae bacterium]
MKRRKQSMAPSARASRHVPLATGHAAADILALLTEQAARAELKERLLEAKQKRPVRRTASKQPPPSEEMKTVTEIGSPRWKPGQTR